MNEEEIIQNLIYPDTMYRRQIEELEDKNTKLQSQIDEVKELTSKYDLSNIRCSCNCLRNFIGNLEQILSKQGGKIRDENIKIW